MIADSDFKEIAPKVSDVIPSAEHVNVGVPIPKAVRVNSFSPEQWEEFIEEWASGLTSGYLKVRRFGGAGDKGIDIAGFATEAGLKGGWDNYQCKHYDRPLTPSDIWVEIGKAVYYSWKEEYSPPENYFFVCPQGIGTKLEYLLNDTSKLKCEARENWDNACRKKITSTEEIELDGALLEYFLDFDFSIFKSKSVLELIAAHEKTRYHAVRFGGGLPPRPPVDRPPQHLNPHESRYVRQLLDAYGDQDGATYADALSISTKPKLVRDFLRQRERFYHAESLRNFSRDTVPTGTFESLLEELYHGVVETCEAKYENGFERMRATLKFAVALPPFTNALSAAVKTQDRQGICHLLANVDRLIWVEDNADG